MIHDSRPRPARGRVSRWAVAGIALLPALVIGAPTSSGAADLPAAGPFGTTVLIDGHGYGHGIGLSQYGALGYAVDHGLDYQAILGHYYGGTLAGTTPPGSISVRLTALDGAATAVVAGPSGAPIQTSAGPGAFQSLVAVPTAANTYDVWGHPSSRECAGGDLVAKGWTQINAAASGPVELFPAAGDTTAAPVADLIGVCETNGQVRSHRGYLYAANDTAGNRRTLNVQLMESYLRSVVGAEVSWSWGNEGGGKGMHALFAQAVAARSYALGQNRYDYVTPPGSVLDVSPSTCDTQACQVYRGAALRSSPSAPFTPDGSFEFALTDQAVGTTNGQVRRWPNGSVVSTMFSSSSGGWTSGGGGFPPVEDLGDDVASNKRHNWTLSVPVSTIESKWPSIGTLQSITVAKRNGLGDFGGRITPDLGKVVVIAGSTGSVSLTGDEARAALGLYSNWFQVRTACAGRDEPPITTSWITTPPSGFTPISAQRVVDTRTGAGATVGPVLRACTLPVSFPSKPAGTTAVALNVTTTNSMAQGFITAYPCGSPRPLAAGVQTQVNADIPAMNVVPLGPDGRVCLYASVTTDIVVDVMGWYTSSGGSKFVPESPSRLLDSRLGGPHPGPGTVVRVQVTGKPGRPANATAASVNVVGTEARHGTFVTAYPCGPRELTSVVNVRPGVDTGNHALVPLDASGGFCLWASNTIHLVVDIDGVFAPSGQSFTFSPPTRAVDTRQQLGTGGRFVRNETRLIDLGPASGSVAFVLTAVDPGAPGHVTVWKPDVSKPNPCGTVPITAVVNAPARTHVAAFVMVPTDSQGRICVNTFMPTDLVMDISGRSN